MKAKPTSKVAQQVQDKLIIRVTIKRNNVTWRRSYEVLFYYSPSGLIYNKNYSNNRKVISLELGKMRISVYSACMFLVLKRFVDQNRI